MAEALRVGQAMGVVGEVDVKARIAYAARLDNVKTSMLQDFERPGRSKSIRSWERFASWANVTASQRPKFKKHTPRCNG